MTSHEILKASMLDILFENRNKQYGAYTLRKFYANRMGIALAISLSSVLILFILLPSSSTSAVANLAAPPPIVLTQVDMKPPETVVPEQPKAQPAANVKAATVDYQDFRIVEDVLAVPLLPTTDDIANAVISNTTVSGVANNEQHVPQPSINGNGETPVQATTSESSTFDPVEKQPEFPGGADAWRNFLSRYLNAPDELAAGERRTVHVRFIVNTSGEVTNFEIIQSAGSSFDREVIRVLKKMPKWKPAIQNGREIAISFVQPVTFQGIEE